ncbi:hypothetical protein [Curtobacterium oceanosedimentum]|uniref:hypothetical protein n=1 Tax=Curtobacterium oceanosedimentum TaxID=465820 RepID=UPI00339A9897
MSKHPVTITADQLSASHIGSDLTIRPADSRATITAPLIAVRSNRDDVAVRVSLEGVRGTDPYAMWPLDPSSEVIVTPASEERAS